MIRQVLSKGKKALVVLPFVSIVREKAKSLSKVLSEVGSRVSEHFAVVGGTLEERDHVAVATLEKAYAMLNRLIEDNRINELGIVVVDEAHMMGNRDRGPMIEGSGSSLTRKWHSRFSLTQASSSRCAIFWEDLVKLCA